MPLLSSAPRSSASALAAVTGDALVCVVFHRFIVGADRSGHRILYVCQVIVLVSHGDVNVDGTGFSVAAVGALPLAKGVPGGAGQHTGVVLLLYIKVRASW